MSSVRSLQHDPPSSIGEAGTYGFRLVIAPASGRLRHLPPATFRGGEEWVSPGQAVAVIELGSDLVVVEAPSGGRLAGVLVRDGEPVLRGQPVVWLDDTRPRSDRLPGSVGTS